MTARTLIAGVGNVFLGDDGFGVEVVNRLAESPLPPGVRIQDFGIRGVHLAYELLNGYDALILVDAAPRGGEPGTVYVIEVPPGEVADPATGAHGPLMDAHDLSPGSVLALLRALGGAVGTVRVVGCEPQSVREHMGLSEPVARAVDSAVRAVRELTTELTVTEGTP